LCTGRGQRLQDAAELVAMAVAHDQRLADGVTQRTDADLQRAAVLDQAGCVQADGVVGGRHLVVRRPEQRVRGRRVGDHHVEQRGRHLGAIGHEGHLAVDHRHLQQRAALGGVALEHFEGDVGVARQAQPHRVALAAHGHRLRDHVHALHAHVARDEGVVGRDVALLRHRIAQVVAGLHEELAHLHVGRQRMRAQVLHVVQVGVVLEQALDQRAEEMRLELTLAHRPLQRQRRDDAQPPRGVGLDAPVQQVDEGVGLADAQRNAEHDVALHGVEHMVDGGVEAVDEEGGMGHGVCLRAGWCSLHGSV
jgi:hypothetical protein